MMLRELKAFEACWLDLKDVYPTSGQDNMLIAHAMGQLVDCLAKPNQVEQDLPSHLQGLFRRLALAYFQGYSATERQAAAAVVTLPVPQPCSHGDRQRRQDISAAVERVKTLARQTQSRMCTSRGQAFQCVTSEMETLIIHFSD
jgi:hypothetical protein